MPAGDTLVSWIDPATVTHTGSFVAETSRAGLLSTNKSRSQGLATVVWAGRRPRAFEVRWLQSDAPEQHIQGTVRDGTLYLTGTSTARMALPALSWAVADEGMEDLLVPALPRRRLPAALRLAVFRPATLRWDTLAVTVSTHAGGRVVQLRSAKACRWLALGREGRLLWSIVSGEQGERRPLETTRLDEEFRPRVSALWKLPACQPAR